MASLCRTVYEGGSKEDGGGTEIERERTPLNQCVEQIVVAALLVKLYYYFISRILSIS